MSPIKHLRRKTLWVSVAEQLDGERRKKAWQQIIASQSRYREYQEKTDRVLPVIRLTQVD
ncbi:nitroreductase/quinone reductase family protein [Pseudonocardia sp.]|uniref:nitroreductase/quinone reductase family protein n=1 Tax=Pseudonocardia sp. TaxID=60912 RepID=UPI0039C9F5E7